MLTDGNSPLHCAALANSPEIIKLLLGHHPKFRFNNKGQISLEVAKEKHYSDLIFEDYIKGNAIQKILKTKSTSSTGVMRGATGDVRPKQNSKIITESQITKYDKMVDKGCDPQRDFVKLGMLEIMRGVISLYLYLMLNWLNLFQ